MWGEQCIIIIYVVVMFTLSPNTCDEQISVNSQDDVQFFTIAEEVPDIKFDLIKTKIFEQGKLDVYCVQDI